MNLSRNIVIEASAGTGKTYTLVQTILQALFEKNLPMEAVVALTFTKKAAGEMKERIAAELTRIVDADSNLKDRAREALEKIDLASIGTIHSFAYSLLKRFPLAAGISPDAEVDDKNIRGDDLFELEWPAWLRQQLRPQTSDLKEQETTWLEVLERVSLDQIRDLARRLCDFDIPLDALPLSDKHLKQQLEPFYVDVQALLIGKPEKVKSTRIAQACEEVLAKARLTPSPSPDRRGERSITNPLPSGEGGRRPGEAPFPAETLAALEETPDKTKDWTADEVRRLKLIRLIALNLIEQGDRTLALLTELLKPFIQRFRGTLLAEGLLSNNALLVLARDLVAQNPGVRETLKRQIRIIFIDEFQDTDPLQGELLLYLAEMPGQQAKRWDAVQLEPGKLFIVGDPKQSIYLFRGADISAYNRITNLVLEQGGERHPLKESYRSHDRIIHAVNVAFTTLIQEKPPVSPPYQPLIPRRNAEDPERHLVELRLAHSPDPRSSDDALKKEAEDAAGWIAEAKAAKRWTYKDIALIFRSAPTMTPFIETLRTRNIPFVVGGERYFYRTPEVTDVLNLLRVLDDPANRIALAGFLRSPLGGFNDAELAVLQEKNGLRLEKPLPKELDGAAHHGAWELLRGLRKRVGRQPLKNILHHVYEDSYLLELAARSYHRDQTIANMNKLRRLMESFAEEGETTLSGLLKKIDRFMEDDRLEGESPLADETYDAVRLLTIHGAKGLEFPVVWLPGLHRHTGAPPETTKVNARYDWSTERLGIAVGRAARNIGDFILEKEFDAREEAEEARVLYVAMTRARDHLILSGGVCNIGRSKQPASGSFLAQLAGAWGIDLEHVSEGEFEVGEGVMTVRRSPASTEAPVGEPAESEWLRSLDPATIAEIWKKREKIRDKTMETRLVVTPSGLKGNAERGARSAEEGFMHEEHPTSALRAPRSALLGTLIHRFLESWDFACEKCDMPAKLRHVANSYFASLGLLKQPFPDPREGDKTDNPRDLVETVEEAQRLLADFIGSDAWEEIKNSEIIGREVPFFYKVDGALMRGFMDILYRTPDGLLVIGDYKTDKDHDDARYTQQAKAYQPAIQLALGEKASFKLIYLRDEISAPARSLD